MNLALASVIASLIIEGNFSNSARFQQDQLSGFELFSGHLLKICVLFRENKSGAVNSQARPR
jgi:hypothetical protein